MNILSIDGGGLRGVIVCCIIEKILEKNPDFLNKTDVFVGTSTGGIISLGLAQGSKITTLKDFYILYAKDIFNKSLFAKHADMNGLLGADYDNTGLKEVLEELFGTKKLNEFGKKRVVITAFDVSKWKPKIFHNFPGLKPDNDQLARNVALYTASAPTYFRIANNFTDGGVCVNNPSAVGLCQVLDRRAPSAEMDDIKLLSISTGANAHQINDPNGDWGLLKWAPKLIDVMMEGAANIADYQCRQLLGDRYQRIKFNLPKPFHMDDTSKLSEMVALGNNEELWEASSIYGWIKNW